jgi:hypothetical protein
MRSREVRNELSTATRDRLFALHQALLHLHKLLLDAEKRGYEQSHGSVTPNQLFNLAFTHPDFDWLRVLSQHIIRIDEMLEMHEPSTEADATALFTATRAMLLSTEEATEFQRKYHRALSDPATATAHAEVWGLLEPSGRVQ